MTIIPILAPLQLFLGAIKTVSSAMNKEALMFGLFTTVLLLLFVVTICEYQNEGVLVNRHEKTRSVHQQWTCTDSKCQKTNSDSNNGVTLETCQMTCGDSPPLWPKPKQLDIINKNSTGFMKEHVFLSIHSPESVKDLLEDAANRFLDSLVVPQELLQYHLFEGEQQIVKLNLHVKDSDAKPTTTTNESYTLYCQKVSDSLLVNVFASNYFGARHGLETLSQLIWYDELSRKFRLLHDVRIADEPSFNHRGLLIDVSRHYFPIDLLKKAVDGMAASKLNVLHLHISDVTSFPLELPSNKRLASKGAYDYDLTYSAEDVRGLVDYARIRGIRTIMEIDAPSHVSPQAFPENEVLCSDPDIFKTTLNPDNPETFDRLQSIYSDLFQLGTDTETFHVGDDEVITDCWRSTQSARNEKSDIYSVWIKFTNQMLDRVKAANNGTIPKNIMLWSSPLTDKYIKRLAYQNDLVVQFWFGKFNHILDNGHKIIFSTVGQWYLDCGFGPWQKSRDHGVCDPYTDWKKFYTYRPWKDYSERLHQVLGGEVCLWSEQVSPDDLETRLWPRTAAFAERVWSDPAVFERDDVFKRMDFHTRRMRLRGFRVAAIWPQICTQFPDKC